MTTEREDTKAARTSLRNTWHGNCIVGGMSENDQGEDYLRRLMEKQPLNNAKALDLGNGTDTEKTIRADVRGSGAVAASEE